MQKNILALAIAAAFAAPVAMAQTTVNVYGSADAGVQVRSTDAVTPADNKTTMGSALFNSNRWGIKASEDMGDGMSANVVLEGTFNTATGVGTGNGATPTAVDLFARGASVGVTGGFGSVVMGGNQPSVANKVIGGYEPFNYKFLGQTGSNFNASGSGTAAVAATNEVVGTAAIPARIALNQNGSSRAATGAVAAVAGKAETAAVAATSATQGLSQFRYDNDLAYSKKFGDLTVLAHTAMSAAGNGSATTNGVGASYVWGDLSFGGSYSATSAVPVDPATLTGATAAANAAEVVRNTTSNLVNSSGNSLIAANSVANIAPTQLHRDSARDALIAEGNAVPTLLQQSERAFQVNDSAAAGFAAGNAAAKVNYANAVRASNAANAAVVRASTATAATPGSKYYTMGAAYKMGDAKVFMGMSNTATDAWSNNNDVARSASINKNMWTGISYKLSTKVDVTLAHYNNQDDRAANRAVLTTTRNVLGTTYALSKRTLIYASLDQSVASIKGPDNIKAGGGNLGLSTSF